MTIRRKAVFIFSLFSIVFTFIFSPLSDTYAATSPSLGSSDRFVILAGSAVTNIPTSTITGDVGLSPASGSFYTGITSAQVNGTIYAVDAAGPAGSINDPGLLTTAKTDSSNAYDNLNLGDNANANCIAPYTFGSGTVDLVGANLVPGVYCADAFELSGALTLSGSGVWVFKSGSTLVTAGASIVGGDPCNVWWRVPSSATLGTGTALKGNVMASDSITMVSGATLDGRIHASTAAITLENNTISNAACTAAATPTPTPASGSSSSSSSSSSNSTGGTTTGPILNYIPPTIIESRRVDADSIYISWGPYSGTDTFIVQYGLENGVWLYSTNVTGFSTTLNDLPSNQPIWVRVAPRDNNSIGAYGEARLVGGPRLPNAGFEPHGNNSRPYNAGQYSYKDFNASCSHSEELHFY